MWTTFSKLNLTSLKKKNYKGPKFNNIEKTNSEKYQQSPYYFSLWTTGLQCGKEQEGGIKVALTSHFLAFIRITAGQQMKT